MRIINILLLSLVLLMFGEKLYSQEPRIEQQHISFDDFSINDQEKIQGRWSKFQPRIELILLSGDTVSGQLIYVDDAEFIIYPGHEVIFNPSVFEDLISLSIGEISKIQVLEGGLSAKGVIIGAILGGAPAAIGGLILSGGWSIIPPIVLGGIGTAGGVWLGSKIQKSDRSTVLDLRQPDSDFLNKYSKIKKSAVFTDSLFVSDDINEIVNSSKALRRSFPDKHFRVSFGLSVGPNTLRNEIEETLESTSLPTMTEYRTGPLSLEFFDFSWRFSDRYIVGGQVFLNADSYTYLYYSNSNNDNSSVYYNYDIQLFGGKIYVDYALKPVNRFFTRPYEILLGGGVIFASPNTNFTYSYVPDETTGNNEHIEFWELHSIPGVQLRSAFHYYPFPGFSISAGLEGNLIKSLSMPVMTLPTPEQGVNIIVPEHILKFSSVRLKVGASFYF